MIDNEPVKTAVSPTDLDWLAEKLGVHSTTGLNCAFEPLLSAMPSGMFIYPAGSVVLREGEPGRDICIIRSGSVSVSRKTGLAAPVELGRLQEGDFFGELGFLMKTPRTATVTAETECRIFRFPADSFAAICAKNPALERKLRQTAQIRLEKIFLEQL
ncbi:MAG: cyclic nucleotide-binding domain-containing protein [Elusimicrobiales bacterium]